MLSESTMHQFNVSLINDLPTVLKQAAQWQYLYSWQCVYRIYLCIVFIDSLIHIPINAYPILY